MNIKVKKLMCIIVLMAMLGGCSLTDNVQTDIDVKKEDSDFIYPVFEKYILTDLCNCDMKFMKNMLVYNFSVSLFSTEELDEESTKLSFDTDMEYEVEFYEKNTIGKEDFGYALFCAYNGYKIQDYGEVVDEMSLENYEEVIINNNNINDFYEYDFIVNLIVQDSNQEYINTYEDTEINHMTVEYQGNIYKFDIGSISMDFTKECKEKFGDTLAGEDSAYIASAALNYIPLENTKEGLFDFCINRLILTENKEMTIHSINISNVDNVKIENIQVTISNDEQTLELEYEEGNEFTIPKNSEVEINVIGQLDVLKECLGYYGIFLLDVGYSIDDIEEEFQYTVVAKAYTRTPYERYAYLIDDINIFDYYLDKVSYYD